MSGDMTKTDSAGPPKLKPEGKHGIGSIRTPKNAPILENVNGDQPAVDRNGFIAENINLSVFSNPIRNNSNQIRMPCLNSTTCSTRQNSEETKHLREMILLNLDLIQKQHELIQNKDKTIKGLKSEKEALKCRLERMERRMSLLKQHQESGGKQVSEVSPSSVHTQNQETSFPKQDKGTKRKSSFEPQNLNKKFATSTVTNRERHDSSDVESVHSTRSAKGKQKDTTRNNRSKQIAQQTPLKDQKEISANNQQKFSRIRHLSPEEKSKTSHARNSEDDELRTERRYYSQCEKYYLRERDLSPKKSKQQCVEVPRSRIVTYTNSYQLEGTENLEDEIFLKRHQKPELEEKRRKRWDMQRLREQRMNEKLLQGRYASKLKKQIKQEDREPETFLPKLDDAQYIEVCYKIPVGAFGYSIPGSDESEFVLPWYDESIREKQEKCGGSKKRR